MYDKPLTIEGRIARALVREEIRAEKLANRVRFLFLLVLTLVVVLNTRTVSLEANLLNGGALLTGYLYGWAIAYRIRVAGYLRSMKYITSCLDVCMVYLLLSTYALIEDPVVVFKNYAFLALFPVIALTVFRYDFRLTVISGGLSLTLYLLMILFFTASGRVEFVVGGYAQELFSASVTYIGQLTKVLILAGYIALLAYLARYSRKLFARVLIDEISIRTEKEKIDAEMQFASRVQRQFLPQHNPEIPGFMIWGESLQGRFVGGDYYDIISLGGESWWLISADVSGKGVPAALVMAEVRAAVHLLASQKITLEELAGRLNTLLLQSTEKKNFVTLFAAELDAGRRNLTYLNAGHPPPLLLSGEALGRLNKGTIPLGVMEKLPGLSVHSLVLADGDVLVCYTDGITERMNPSHDFYGEERLGDFVKEHRYDHVRDLTLGLLGDAKAFGSGREYDDDVTLLVARCGSVADPANSPAKD